MSYLSIGVFIWVLSVIYFAYKSFIGFKRDEKVNKQYEKAIFETLDTLDRVKKDYTEELNQIRELRNRYREELKALKHD